MTAFKDTLVYRGGASASQLPTEATSVELVPLQKPDHCKRVNVGVVRLSFSIAASGGGRTVLFVDVGDQDFPAMVAAMAALSPGLALPAMAAAVAEHMAKLPEREALIRKQARREVLYRATAAFQRAPEDNNEVEKLVAKRVGKFVEELEPKPVPPAPKPALVSPSVS